MKTRLAINIDEYPTTLLLLFGLTYFNGAGFILSYWNAHVKPGPVLSYFLISGKGRLRGKIEVPVYLKLFIKHDQIGA